MKAHLSTATTAVLIVEGQTVYVVLPASFHSNDAQVQKLQESVFLFVYIFSSKIFLTDSSFSFWSQGYVHAQVNSRLTSYGDSQCAGSRAYKKMSVNWNQGVSQTYG